MLSDVTASTLNFFMVFFSPSRKILLIVLYLKFDHRLLPRPFQFVIPVILPLNAVQQCFSTFVRPRPGKFIFDKTMARSQQIYSSVLFQFFLSSYINLTYVLIINYGIIIKSISTNVYGKAC